MSRSIFKPALIAAAISAAFVPLSSYAADDVGARIDALNRQLEAVNKELAALKARMQAQPPAAPAAAAAAEADAADEKWLTIGGDYQFRIDSLRGQTRPFTDVNAMFSIAQGQLQQAFFANPTPANGAMLNGFINFAQGMSAVGTFAQAQSFLGANAAMLGGLASFAPPAFVPAYKPKNDSIYSNRLGLDLKADVAENITFKARLVMYKTFGAQDDYALVNGGGAPFFADRVGVFDGTLGRFPSSSLLNVDRAYVTWAGIGGLDAWFSVGRRPSTDGTPLHLKANTVPTGTAGTPALLVNYAFDGMTFGYMPDIAALPGAYAKLCYGRGFENGYSTPGGNSLDDTDMVGISVVPYETEDLKLWVQWNRGMNIFDAPTMKGTYFGDTRARTNLGDIDWYGVGVMGRIGNLGSGTLNYFADVGVSVTRPNDNVSAQFGFQGLLTGGFFNPEAPSSKTGNAIFVGLRYDLPSRTKLGFEFNRGSENWITFAPAAADMWTSKLGTRGTVYDVYVIQELNARPIASAGAKAFFRLGYQAYDFKYTGSNNWVGAPVKMSDVQGQMSALTPLSKAYDLYGTFEVKF